MLHSPRPRGRTAALLAVATLSFVEVLTLAACGGTAAGSSEAATGTLPPHPMLDLDLMRLARKANAAPLATPPPQDPDRIALGRALFFDRILSGNRNISCYTCHDVDFASADGLSVSIGTGGFGKGADRLLANGLLIPRNAPALFHLAGRKSLFLDSRVSRGQGGSLTTPEPALNGPAPAAAAIAAALPSALAAQAMFPVTSREEMRGQPGENEIADAADDLEVWSRLMRRLVGTADDAEPGIPEYRDLFARAYPGVASVDDLNFGHAAQAIAAFEISAFSTRGSAFDAWLLGTSAALTDTEKRGGILFYGRAPPPSALAHS